MAFPRLSASMLLASWILLLYWTTSSAGSPDPTSSDLSPPYRVKRELAFRTREQVQQSLIAAKASLTVISNMMEKSDSKTVKNVMKCLSTVASLVPGIGSLVAPMINLVLAVLPQENPLSEVKQGFAEVNRKLDSLSNQISNLATDVEWFNYASVYSQDEVRILNAWKKFNELQDNSGSVKSEEDKLRLAEIFVNYYENTGTEASVANFYHYLTVTNTSLSGNLNDLLKKKFKCDIRKIGDYNIHFSTLLWRGMVLNQFYWKLIGFDLLDKKTEHTEMIKEVYTAQISAIDYCLDNYEQYMKKDVEETSKGLSHDDKTAVAAAVKTALDEKYYWYNWVVMVYDTYYGQSHTFSNMIKIPVGKISVAVSNLQKAEEIHKTQVRVDVLSCFAHPTRIYGDYNCDNITNDILQCSKKVAGVPVREYVKVMYTLHPRQGLVSVPEELEDFFCMLDGVFSKTFIYYSRNISVCSNHTCENEEQCKRLLDTNEYLCLCPDGYHRENCTEQEKPRDVPLIDRDTVPDISTINTKLKKTEEKLDVKLKLMEGDLKVIKDKLDEILGRNLE